MNLKILISAILLLCIAMPLPAIAAAPIYISQIQITGGAGKTSNDFIELFNPNDAITNLNGYRLVKRTAHATADTLIKSWTADALIPAHGFYLWANTGYVDIAVLPDVTTGSTLADDNGIALRAPDELATIPVESVAWGNVDNGFVVQSATNPEAGKALLRTDLYQAGSAFAVAVSTPRNSQTINGPPVPMYATPYATPLPVEVPETTYPTPYETPYSTPYATPYPTPVAPPSLPNLHITEVYPNPPGDDAGNEVVEIKNEENSAVSMYGWILDDGITSTQPKSGAYTIPDVVVAAGSVLVVQIPKGKLALNNSGGDALHLFAPNKQLIESVFYSGTAPEGKSYQIIDATWFWDVPTLGTTNHRSPVPPEEPDPGETISENNDADTVPAPTGAAGSAVPDDVVISELLPNPAKGQKEFVELHNTSSIDLVFTGWKLDVGSRTISLSSITVPGSGYVIVSQENLPPLTNKGTTVVLKDQQGREVDSVVYGNAPRGRAYARTVQDEFEWSTVPTPGEENIFTTGIPLAASAEPAPIKTKASASSSSGSLTKSEKSLQAQIRQTTDLLAVVSEQLRNVILAQVAEPVPSPQPSTYASEEVASGSHQTHWFLYGGLIAGLLLILGACIFIYRPAFLEGGESDKSDS